MIVVRNFLFFQDSSNFSHFHTFLPLCYTSEMYFRFCRWAPSHREGSIWEFTNYTFMFHEFMNHCARVWFTISLTWFLSSHEFKIRNIWEFTNSQTNFSISVNCRWRILLQRIIDDIVCVNSWRCSFIFTNSSKKKSQILLAWTLIPRPLRWIK